MDAMATAAELGDGAPRESRIIRAAYGRWCEARGIRRLVVATTRSEQHRVYDPAIPITSCQQDAADQERRVQQWTLYYAEPSRAARLRAELEQPVGMSEGAIRRRKQKARAAGIAAA